MRSGYFAYLATAAVIALPTSVQAAPVAPFSFDTAYGRLPKTLIPIDYSVSITPNAADRTLTGSESIVLEFRHPSATIIFNSLNEVLRDVRLDGKPVKAVASSDEQQLTTVTLDSAATAGRHTLTFSYSGKIESGPRGMFAQPYVKPDGDNGLLIQTKFESTDARRMFPCWDEPAFRSTFQISLTVPAEAAVVSNMPVARRVVHDALATTTFLRTPKMPTYLVELSAGDLARITAHTDGVEIGIWAVRGQEKQGAEALANAQQILADYDDYFGYKYPLPKLDSIAVPGGQPGAMENWGAIAYNDQLLLLSPLSTILNHQTVYSVQAHEMAHQWNGDLVTMGWWDDIWLNESFASWRAAEEADLRNPGWRWWEGEDASKETAMSADARITSHAIQQHVTDELQVTNAFDKAITYNKGEAVLRMLEGYLGPATFRKGVRAFIRAHAYSNATSTDLWNALSAASGRNVGEVSADWIEQPGFPLVAVSATCDAAGKRTLALSQQRFLLQGADSRPSHWAVPLQIRSGAAGAPQAVLLQQDGQTFKAGRCDQALTLNAGALGCFRAAYDAAPLRSNAAQFGPLPDPDRIALLDDRRALVQAVRQELARFLALASSMGSDLDERAWMQISTALETIEYAERGKSSHDAFTAYAFSIFQPVAARLGWDSRPDESPGTQRLRRTVLVDLGSWGDREVIAEARKRFAAFMADHSAIRPDDQRTVLEIVTRNADAATFEQLHQLARSASNETEQRRYYAALMHVRDPQLAAQAAQIAVSSEIPPQSAAVRLGLVGGLTFENPKLAWATFTANLDMLMLPQGRYAAFITAQLMPETLWDAAPPDEIETWIRAHVPAEMADNVARSMEIVRFKLAQKTSLAQAADSFLSARMASRG